MAADVGADNIRSQIVEPPEPPFAVSGIRGRRFADPSASPDGTAIADVRRGRPLFLENPRKSIAALVFDDDDCAPELSGDVGVLTVGSEKGRGSTFAIDLPTSAACEARWPHETEERHAGG